MTIYTAQQKLYIRYFMEEIDLILAKANFDTGITLKQAIDMANTGVNTTENLVNASTVILGVLSVGAAVPTAGISLAAGLAAAGAAITLIQVGHGVYQFVKQHSDAPGAEVTFLEREEQLFWLKRCAHEVADAYAIRYAHYLNKTPDREWFEAAQFAARVVIKTLASFDVHQPIDMSVLLDVVHRHSQTLKMYERPRVAYLTLEDDAYRWIGYASNNEESWNISAFKKTKQSYGYMTGKSDDIYLQAYIKARKASLLANIETSITKHFFAYHLVTRPEVEAYIKKCKTGDYNKDLNVFLYEQYGINLIASCHDDRLKGLDLSFGIFHSVNFRRADLQNCQLAHTRWIDARLTEVSFGVESDTAYLSTEGMIIESSSLEKTQWHRVTFDNTLISSSLNGARLTDCDLSLLQHINCTWYGVTLNTQPQQSFLSQFKALNNRLERIEHRIHQVEKIVSIVYQDAPVDLPELLHPIYKSFKKAMDNELLQATLHYYIESDVLPRNTSGEVKRLTLFNEVDVFLEKSEKFILFHGDTGAGKSLSLRALQNRMWCSWLDGQKLGWIPILIELKQIRTTNFLEEILKKQPYSYQLSHIEMLKKSGYRFLILLDGLDECMLANSHELLHGIQIDSWDNAKFLLTARTEWLQAQPDYHKLFPVDHITVSIVEYQIPPFTEKQINNYLQLRYAKAPQAWTYYRDLLYAHQDVSAMLASPVMLHIFCDEAIIKALSHDNNSSQAISRIWVYKTFLNAWFQRAIDKLRTAVVGLELSDHELLINFLDYTQNLALDMYSQNHLRIERVFSRQSLVAQHLHGLESNDYWGKYFDFTNKDIGAEVLRQALRSCPLTREYYEDDNKRIYCYEFIHKSFMEYAAATALWHSLLCEDSIEKKLSVWNQRFVAHDLGVLSFLTEYLAHSNQRTVAEKQLLEFVYSSKRQPEYAKAASSAITLLNRVHFNFSQRARDLSYIQIPEADLSGALLALVNLEHCDLSNACFHEASLIGSSLVYSQATRTRFLTTLASIQTKAFISKMVVHPHYTDLVSYSNVNTVVLSDLSTGQVYKCYAGHKGAITALAWSPDGKKLASSSLDGTIRIWDISRLADEACIFVLALKGNNHITYTLAWGSNTQFASAGSEHSVHIWTIEQRADQDVCQLTKTFQGHKAGIHHLAWSLDGQRLASVDKNMLIRIWLISKPLNEACALILNQDSQVAEINCLVWLPDGRLVSGGRKDIKFWETKQNSAQQPIAIFSGHSQKILDLVVSPDGMQIASASADQTIGIWQLQAEHGTNPHLAILREREGAVNNISWSADGQYLISSQDKNILVWDIKRSLQNNVKNCKEYTSIAWSHNGKLVALGDQIGKVIICVADDFLAGRQNILCEITGHTRSITCLTWSSCDKWLISGSTDKQVSVAVFDYSGLIPLKNQWLLSEHDHAVLCVAISPCGRYFASGGLDSDIHIWVLSDENMPTRLQSLKGHIVVNTLAWSPDGAQLVSGGRDTSIYVWRSDERGYWSRMAVLNGHAHEITSLVWSPDGKKIASTSSGQRICIWDMATRSLVQRKHAALGQKRLFWQSMETLVISHPDKLHIWHFDTGFFKFNFGSIVAAHYQQLLTLVYKQTCYVFDLTTISNFHLVTTVGPKNFWVAGCDLTNTQQLSPHIRQFLQEKGAIGDGTYITGNKIHDCFNQLITARVMCTKDAPHQMKPVAEALEKLADAYAKEGHVGIAPNYYQQSIAIYKTMGTEVFLMDIARVNNKISALKNNRISWYGLFRNADLESKQSATAPSQVKQSAGLF